MVSMTYTVSDALLLLVKTSRCTASQKRRMRPADGHAWHQQLVGGIDVSRRRFLVGGHRRGIALQGRQNVERRLTNWLDNNQMKMLQMNGEDLEHAKPHIGFIVSRH